MQAEPLKPDSNSDRLNARSRVVHSLPVRLIKKILSTLTVFLRQEDEISSDTIANLIMRNFIGSRLVDKNTIEISDDHKRRSIVKAVCSHELLQGIEGPDFSTWC